MRHGDISNKVPVRLEFNLNLFMTEKEIENPKPSIKQLFQSIIYSIPRKSFELDYVAIKRLNSIYFKYDFPLDLVYFGDTNDRVGIEQALDDIVYYNKLLIFEDITECRQYLENNWYLYYVDDKPENLSVIQGRCKAISLDDLRFMI
jgi:hypothetical protein